MSLIATYTEKAPNVAGPRVSCSPVILRAATFLFGKQKGRTSKQQRHGTQSIRINHYYENDQETRDFPGLPSISRKVIRSINNHKE